MRQRLLFVFAHLHLFTFLSSNVIRSGVPVAKRPQFVLKLAYLVELESHFRDDLCPPVHALLCEACIPRKQLRWCARRCEF